MHPGETAPIIIQNLVYVCEYGPFLNKPLLFAVYTSIVANQFQFDRANLVLWNLGNWIQGSDR